MSTGSPSVGLAPNVTDLHSVVHRQVRVAIAINEHVLRVAAQSILRLENIPLADADKADFVLTDDLRSEGENIILLADESPAEAYASVWAFTSGRVGGLASLRRPESLPLAIHAAREGLSVIPRSLLAAAFDAPQLTDQQVRILALLIEGLTNTSIARRLALGETTVKRHVTNLLRAFNCTNRTELVRRASNVGFSSTSRSIRPQS